MKGTGRILPFNPEFAAALRSGRKTMTTRTAKAGAPGAVMDTYVGPIVIREVRRISLREVRDNYWRQEGVDSPEAFEEVWKRIHPRKGWQPSQMVYLHRFELLNRNGEERPR